MSEVVSTFVNVDRGKSKYLFFLVRVNDYESTIKEEIEKNCYLLARHLASTARLLRHTTRKRTRLMVRLQRSRGPLNFSTRCGALEIDLC
jgi:hypothetical protein